MRAWLLPDWGGAIAVLADSVLVVGALCAIGQLLGSVGLFRLIPVTLVCASAGVGAAVLAHRQRGSQAIDGPRQPRVQQPRVELAVAGIAVALVTAMWSTWVAQAYEFGIGNGDSVWYHLPIAARFVQDGWITNLQFLNGEALVTYYPANGSLLHAFGFLAFGHDDLSLVLNFAILPLVLLGGWCIGQRRGTGPAALTGVAVVMALPIVTATQPGSAKDDALSVAFFLAAVALAMHAGRRAPGLVISGAAAGLALGAKLTMLVPFTALGIGVLIVCARSGRRALAGGWWIAAAVTGSFWYLRNLIAVGNPVPSFDVDLGPIGLPSPPTPSIDRFGPAIVEFLTSNDAWSRTFRPGFENAFGPAWPAIVGFAVAGAVLGIIKLRGIDRAVGVSALAVGMAFLVTPGTAFAVGVIDVRGASTTALLIFAYNLRYLVPALAAGLALLPLAPWFERGSARLALLGTYAAVLLVTQASDSGLRAWSPNHESVAFVVLGSVLVLFASAGLFRARQRTANSQRGNRAERRQGRLLWMVIGLTIIIVIGPGWIASRSYHDDRYATHPLNDWVKTQHIRSKRIAMAGFDAQYPLLGDDLSNHVQYVGRRGREGAFAPFDDCMAWRRALRRGRYDYVVTPTDVPTPTLGYDLARWKLGRAGGEPPNEPIESAWNRSDPGLERVYERAGATVYRVGPKVSARGCTRLTGSSSNRDDRSPERH